jgi:hypothetical protein
VLGDYRGRRIVDVLGSAFTTKEATVAGRPAVEFSGSFGGTTVTGYGFSRMRGVMIDVTPTLSLEINHFVPVGTTADFEKDDVVFEQILLAVSFAASTEKGGIPVTVPAATSSGY